MKLLTLTLLISIFFISCNNKPQNIVKKNVIKIDSIYFVPKINKTATFDLELKKTKNINVKGRIQKSSSTSDIKLKITKLDNKNFRCSWNIKKIKITGHTASNLEKKLLELVQGFKYEFLLDSTGIFLELENWKEIQSKGNKVFEVLLEEIKKMPRMNSQILSQIKATVGSMFNSKENIELFLMQEVQAYFSLEGIHMKHNDTITTPVSLPNPITKDLIKQNIKVVFQEAYSDSTCAIRIMQEVDKNDLKSTVNNVYHKMGKNSSAKKINNQLSFKKYDVSIISDCIFSLKTGLPQKITSRKTIIFDKNKRVDEFEITQK